MSLVNPTGLPISLELALKDNQYDKGEADISATELGLSPRIRQLRARHKPKVDVKDRIFALLGTLTHSILESSTRELVKGNQTHQFNAINRVLTEWMSNPDKKNEDLPLAIQKAIWEAVKRTALEDHGIMIENRLYVDVLGWRVSGKADSYNMKQEIMDDYKLCSVWNYIYGAKMEWEQQINTYRYIWAENGYTITKANIHAIFRDWSKSKTFDPKYPKNQWEVMPINLWPLDQAKKYVEDRVRMHQMAEETSEDNLPMCTPEDRWEKRAQVAVTKAGRKRAVKLFDSEAEARDWIARWQKPGEKLITEARPSESVRCINNYCEVRDHCPYGRSLVATESEG